MRSLQRDTAVDSHRIRTVMAKRLFQITTGTIAGLALVGLAMVLGWLPPGPSSPQDPNLLAGYLPAPDLSLTTHTGEPYRLDPTAGTTVVFFGYTHCPDVCPLTLAKLRRAVDSLDEDDHGDAAVRVVFVTVDPERDTSDRLAEYLAPLQPGFIGLTGTEEEIAEVLEEWGIYREISGDPDDYLVDHTARAFVVEPPGRIVATFPPDADAADMARTLGIVLNGR
jgi:protein SCO1/2